MKHTNIRWIISFQNVIAMIDIAHAWLIYHNVVHKDVTIKKLGFQSQITIFTSFQIVAGI